MLKATVLSLAFAVGGMVPAWAASALPITDGAARAHVIKVGEGCGPNMWRDRFGTCRPFLGPGGTARGTRYECPVGHHLGPDRGRCFPNV